MLSLKLYDKHPRAGGVMMADWSLQHEGLAIETEQHGFGATTFTVPMPRADARRWFGRIGAAHIQVNESGTVIYEGRVETPATVDGPPSALSITALGYWRAFSDVLLNTAWSSVDRSQWQPVETAQRSDRAPEEYAFSTEDLLRIAPASGGVFDSGRVGSLSFTFGSTVSKTIQTLDVTTYSLTAPTGWLAVIQAFTVAWGFSSTVWSLAGNGTTQTGSIALSSLNTGRLLVSLYRNRAATTMGTAVTDGTGKNFSPASVTSMAKRNKLCV